MKMAFVPRRDQQTADGFRWRLTAGCLLLLGTCCLAASDTFQRASQLEESGKFAEASNLLAQALQANSPSADRSRLLFEQDRLLRIRKDFPFTQDELYQQLKPAVAGLDRTEFDRWVAEGRFDSREIDGLRYFMASSARNLFFRYPALSQRRRPPQNETELQRRMLEVCREIKRTALATAKPYVLPVRFNIAMTVTASPGAAPDGETIRAWLPLPREYPYQESFELLSSSSAPKQVADGQRPIRSLLLEQPVVADQPTRFRVEYNYSRCGIFFDIKPAAVKPTSDNPALKSYVSEGPHIVFTPEMRELSRKLAEGETNPYLKAKKFYDWIAENIKYSYSIEYSTIRNISEYCRSRGYGDCGQEAMLFMTLCRLNGIPARWQSGWHTFPGAKDIHDWCEIYLEPYGWIPVDPCMAIRYSNSLNAEEQRELRDFYFGGMDEYRLAANSDYCQDLAPVKRSLRSDTVDFQRGELEWGEHNIYFDQFSYALEMKTIPQNKHSAE